MSKRLWIEIAVCCLVSVTLMHFIPSAYVVKQTYELTGNIGSGSEAAQDLTNAIRRELQNPLLKKLKCTQVASSQRIECTAIAQRRSEAKSLATLLRDGAPTKVGWIKKDSLQTKLKETQTQTGLWSSELRALESEVHEIEPKIPEAQRLLKKEQRRKENIENDLTNRKRQLEILEEGITSKPEDERAPFEAKHVEVSKLVSQLQTQLDESNQNLFSIGQPMERQKTILEILPKLRAQLDLARAQIASWSTLLDHAGATPTVADPDHFQLAALPAAKNIIPVRSWSHLPWSSLLGLLVLGFVRRKELSGWKERYYETPEEVTQDTGLPFLGTI